jgi:hypothetical protein
LPSWFAEGKWVSDGVEKFGRYARRKGWIGEAEVEEAREESAAAHREAKDGSKWKMENVKHGWKGGSDKWYGRGEKGVRLLVE